MFGNSLLNIQKHLIQQLPATGKLVILGGGNGEILPIIYKQSPLLEIEYIESSDKMIASAKTKINANQKIIFTQSDNFEFVSTKADVIYSAFFWDIFTEEHIIKHVQQIETNFGKSIKWFVADFAINSDIKLRYLRQFQIFLSILFFRLTVKHRVNYLPKIFKTFKDSKYNILYSKHLSGNFLKAQVLVNSS